MFPAEALQIRIGAALALMPWHLSSWHDSSGRDALIDILAGTILLAIVPFGMAAYGGHVAAESISDPKTRRRVKITFWATFGFGVLLAFLQQYRAISEDSSTKAKTEQVCDWRKSWRSASAQT